MKVEKEDFASDVMFSLLMRNPKLCKEVVEVLLEEEIGEVASIFSQFLVANQLKQNS